MTDRDQQPDDVLTRPYCAVCGKYCDGDAGSAEEPIALDGDTVCGECADDIAEASDGEGHDRRHV